MSLGCARLHFSTPRARDASATSCGDGAPPRPSRGRAAPKAFRSSGAASSREKCPRAASFSSGRAAPGRHCCRERSHARPARASRAKGARARPRPGGARFSIAHGGCEVDPPPRPRPGRPRVYRTPGGRHIAPMSPLTIVRAGHPVLRQCAYSLPTPGTSQGRCSVSSDVITSWSTPEAAAPPLSAIPAWAFSRFLSS